MAKNRDPKTTVPIVDQKDRRYLPFGFHFRVDFDTGGVIKDSTKKLGNKADSGFQEVSGLNLSIETETFQEGGENRFSHRFPKPATYQNLILKRGMLIGSKLVDWIRNAIENFEFVPINIDVHLLDEDQNPLETWTFHNAYPVKCNIDAFNAQDSKIVIETLEICYQYFKRQELKKDYLTDTGPTNLKH